MDPRFDAEVNALALGILRQYHNEIKRQTVTGENFHNVCHKRAPRLLADLQSLGIRGTVIVINSIRDLTHESNAFIHWHHVVLDDRLLVWDPNYTGAVPIPLQHYIDMAYLEPREKILVWKRGDDSQPIGRYDDGMLYLEHSPF